MRNLSNTWASLFFFQLLVFSLAAQTPKLKPGFDKDEFLELLKVSSRQGDSLYNPDLPAPQFFEKVYRSQVIGLANRWDLWLSDKSTAVISIRGTTMETASWLENFYAAMVPAKGQLKLSNDFVFDYNLCDDEKAAVHTGWLIGTAFLSRDILPKLDSLSKIGIKEFYIMGHSQGGAIAYLLTAHFLNLQKANKLSNELVFKTYCSAAPKPGNLHFAYAYENMTKGGWSFTVVNSADWVPEAPFSIQTTMDFNPANPFANAKKAIKKAPFLKRIAMNYFYNSLDKPTQKANKRYQKQLGRTLGVFIKKSLPEYVTPTFFNSNNYARTGDNVVLYADQNYYTLFPIDNEKIWTHHAFEPYLYLCDKYQDNAAIEHENKPSSTIINVEITNKASLDSLVIYDKENGWKIISSLKFRNGNLESDTLEGIEEKIYPIYIFTNGKQSELGKIDLSPNYWASIQLDASNPHASIRYAGHRSNSNNFMAFISLQQVELSKKIDDQITQASLELLIQEKRERIVKEAAKYKVTEGLLNSKLSDYDSFCETLLQKNEKFQYKNALTGTLGNQFTFQDRNGTKVKLDKFLGKYLYIDIWATWCKPCREELPHLEVLKEHFKDQDALEIIAVSMDKDIQKWSKLVADKNMQGMQLHTLPDSDFVKFYDIGALPRYILLDKNGNVINPSEMRPSEAGIIQKLEAAIKGMYPYPSK
jgi:thiol-disulfide isomerase/thioredoxin